MDPGCGRKETERERLKSLASRTGRRREQPRKRQKRLFQNEKEKTSGKICVIIEKELKTTENTVISRFFCVRHRLRTRFFRPCRTEDLFSLSQEDPESFKQEVQKPVYAYLKEQEAENDQNALAGTGFIFRKKSTGSQMVRQGIGIKSRPLRAGGKPLDSSSAHFKGSHFFDVL